MAVIPNDEKVFMVSKSTNTRYSGSTALKAMQEWYTMQDIKDSVGGGLPYKVYTALLNQSGTNDPVATVLENTIGDILFAYDSVGNYYGTCQNLFTINKTLSFIGATHLNIVSFMSDESDSQVNIQTDNSNGILFNTPIEIRVYN